MEKQTINVLVVEDDDQDFCLIKEALRKSERARYLVHHVDSLDAAIRALFTVTFDVVLLDYFLGPDSGYDFLKQANSSRILQPIIAMTGNSSMELDDMLMKEGAADFLPKDDLSTAFLDRTIRHAIERKQSELEIADIMRRDPLTGLGNRTIFEEHMELAIARAGRTGGKLAVVFMDLDRFKDVNDSLGHNVGDLLLALVGDRLRRSVRKSDVVARIGGDEFVVLLDDIGTEDNTESIVKKISDEVSGPAPVGNSTLDVSVSIGVAIYPKNGSTTIELMQKADMALYESKGRDFGSYHFFTEVLQEKLLHEMETEKALRNALSRQEFEMHYQPQIHLKTEKVVGLEALIRWPQQDGTYVGPDDFIPVAVRSGLISAIGRWVIEETARHMRHWHDAGFRVPVSVNVSPKQLLARDFEEHLLDVMDGQAIGRGTLELELTEEAFIDTASVYVRMLDSIRSVGVGIAIDDFGTGYSSMAYLRKLPLDRIKIDRAFVSASGDEGLSEPAITHSIISLAQGLALEVVAEGVETSTQSKQLRQLGCEVCQGFYFYKPMPVEEVGDVLESALAPAYRESSPRKTL